MLRLIIKNNRGMSLVEMVVAVSLFAVTILSATGIFQMTIRGQRNAITTQNVEEGMRYAFEVMAKEIRMAQKNVDIGGNYCGPVGQKSTVYRGVPGGRELHFKNIHEQCVKLEVVASQFRIKRWPNGDVEDGPTTIQGFITPDDIKITDIRFSVVDDKVVSQQSRVTIKMDVEAVGPEMHKQKIKVQTTISSRYYGD